MFFIANIFTWYANGNLVFDINGELEYILMPEGRILNNNGAFEYEYHLKDHLGSVRVAFVPTVNGKEVVQENAYYPFGATIADLSYAAPLNNNRYGYTNQEQLNDFNLNWYDYIARNYNPLIGRFNSIDPLAEKYYSISPYAYCKNNPINRIDPTGMKDTTFVAGKDKPISEQPGTATPIVNSDGTVNPNAYNCHSYAWENSQGDPKDPRNTNLVQNGVTKWDNNPDNNMSGYTQLNTSDPNQKGDRVIYYSDSNGNGKYDPGENIEHSAIVHTVDANGNTTTVMGKMGQAGMSENHPTAPGYYGTDANGNTTSRAYFRVTTTSSTSTGVLPSITPMVITPKTYIAERNATYVAPRLIPILPIRK